MDKKEKKKLSRVSEMIQWMITWVQFKDPMSNGGRKE